MLLRQSHATECGLACLAMVAHAHGLRRDLDAWRQRHPPGPAGTTLSRLVRQAEAEGLQARALRLEPADLPALALPCILHWDLDHFVVLRRAGRRTIVVDDPARGTRRLSPAAFSRHFTGIALELRPGPAFAPREERQRLHWSRLTGPLPGWHGLIARVMAVSLLLEALLLLAPLSTQWVIDEVLPQHDRPLLDLLVAGFALLLALQAGLGWVRSALLAWLQRRVALPWQARAFDHALHLPAAWYRARGLGDVAGRFESLGEIQRALTSTWLEGAVDGLMALGALAMMLWMAPALAAWVCALVLLLALLRLASWRPVRAAAAERLAAHALAQSHLIESLRAVLPIRRFGGEARRRHRREDLLAQVQHHDDGLARWRRGLGAAQSLLHGAAGLGTLWLGARLAMEPAAAGAPFTVGMLMAFLAWQQQFLQRSARLLDLAADWRLQGLHLERLADLMLSPVERGLPGAPAPSTAPAPAPTLTPTPMQGPAAALVAPVPRDGGPAALPAPALPATDPAEAVRALPPRLSLHGLSWRAGPDEPWLLHDLHLEVAPGEHLAITGASGGGKSTLLMLMLGLLAPTEGEVRYGGVPLARLDAAAWRACVGTVLQDDLLLAGSVLQNVSFFDPAPAPARLQACAAIAGLAPLLDALPMGWRTPLGEGGQGLSGGQRQRVLLARALYPRPRLLVLDEATSHLDLEAEREVVGALARLRLTRIAVAHRPETLRHADRVLVLEGGRLRPA